VLQDVKEMLSLKECLVFRASYNRPNLFYEIQVKNSAHKSQMDDMAALIKKRFPSESGKEWW
jgi:ATP-dependent DNA helicase Q1